MGYHIYASSIERRGVHFPAILIQAANGHVNYWRRDEVCPTQDVAQTVAERHLENVLNETDEVLHQMGYKPATKRELPL